MTSVEIANQICTLQHGTRRVETERALSGAIVHLSDNNCCPSDAEAREFQRIVTEASKDVEDIADEIAMARAHLDHLDKERQDAQRVVDLHRRILNSPRRMSEDVLLEIFRLACEASSTEIPHSLDPHQPAWRLAQVCQGWRRFLTNNMPYLWINIKLYVDAKYAKRGFLLEHLLRRSQGRALNVTLLFHEDFRADSAYFPLLTRFTMSCDRWKSLHLEGWADSFNAWNMNFIENNIPQLQALSHQIWSTTSPDLTQLELLHSPALKTLHVVGWGAVPPALAQLKNFSWGRATAGTTRLSMDQCTNFLVNFKNLETYAMDCVYLAPPLPLKPVTMSKLHSLTLHSIIDPQNLQHSIDSRTSEVEQILNHLCLPVLSSLTITGTIYGEQSIIGCLRKSKCRLRSLEIPSLPAEALQRVFALTPSLTHLCISHDGLETGVLSAFTQIIQATMEHCLELHSIQLTKLTAIRLDSAQEESDLAGLVSLIARIRTSEAAKRRLKRLSIYCSGLGKAVLSTLLNANSHLQELVRGGLQFELLEED